MATPRGSQFEGEWLKSVDMTFAYDLAEVFDLPGDSLVLRADVFNIFDFATAQDFNEVGEEDIGNYPGPGAPEENYGKVTRYQTPRHVRLSIAYRF